MGWTSYHVTPVYNPKTKRKKIDRKAECDSHLNCDAISWPDGKVIGKYEVLKSRMVSTTYYAAVKKTIFATANEPETSKVFAAIFLTSVNMKDYHNFSYKDMDESVGPFQYDCPKNILDLLSPTDNEFALEWRRKCYERIEKKKDPTSLQNLPVGSVVYAKMPFNTRFHREGENVRLEKQFLFGSSRTTWYSPRARFTSSLIKQLEGCGAISIATGGQDGKH